MSDQEIEQLKQEANQRLLEYISLLESSNDSLVNTLKQCINLLSRFSETVPDPGAFKKLLTNLEDIVKAGERVVIKKTLH